MKYFNDLADFNSDEILGLLELANSLDRHPEPKALNGKVLALLFFNPSLRTLTSFQAAMTRLGGGTFVVSPEMSIHRLESQMGIVMDGSAAEHIKEAVPVIASYADAIGIRAFAERKDLETDLQDVNYNNLIDLINKPFINMESAINHPCQNLADWKTLDDFKIPAKNGKFVLSWAYHPNALPLAVPASTLHMASMRGMDVTVLRPEGFELPAEVMKKAKAAAILSGGTVTETSDRYEAMQDAHIIYAKSWISAKYYNDKQMESEARKNLVDWRVKDSWFDNALPSCRFMHCLPVRRGVVVDDSVLDGSKSIVIHEARNRMLAQMAVLYQMMK